MNLEYYYLFGLDIPLERHSLGKIRQPKLRDFIDKGMDVDTFYFPFVYNELIISQCDDKELATKTKDSLGSLTYLIANCCQNNKFEVLGLLKQSLGMLYGNEVELGDNFTIIAGDVVLDNSNFDTLCDLVLEMFKVDKKDLKFDSALNEEGLDPITQRFEMLRKEHREKVGKSKGDFKMIDLINSVIHSYEACLNYNAVLNMTIYQIKNSFNTISIKNNSETMMQYKVSPKFEMKEDVKLWNTIKIVKDSTLIKDV